MIKIIDNALPDRVYNDLICQIACGPFIDERNPVDDVVYPLICRSIPKSVTNSVSEIVGGEFIEFMRASPEGIHCPNPVHHDGSMGRISIMLYTSYIGGTAIMRHIETGIMSAPSRLDLVDAIASDSSNIDAWEVMEIAEAKPNRMAIFDARLMHSAMPFGGFGVGVNARTVYTRFAL